MTYHPNILELVNIHRLQLVVRLSIQLISSPSCPLIFKHPESMIQNSLRFSIHSTPTTLQLFNVANR